MGRTIRWGLLVALLAAGLLGCSPSGGDDIRPDYGEVRDGTDGDVVGPPPPDADGDTISDADEGRATGEDFDTDGTPDYLDADSDDDTIPDSLEAGDSDPRTPPGDADGDHIPNFRDIDSDGNGIFDMAESIDDLDHDLALDFADQDDDGDGIGDIDEINGNPALPPDFDGDGIADYRDADSDNDTISDREEATSDVDGDLIPDRFDSDTDADGWTDAEEAGDADVATVAIDTDLDGIPDFRDHDSDADGLLDSLEREAGTSRTDTDSDDDGADDMVEYAAGTDPLLPTDNPHARGDFVFVERYNNPAEPPVPPYDPDPLEDTLVFSTNIQFADVYFLVDCTGSMGGEITNLRSSISGTVIPGLVAAIPDVWIGVGHIDDLPIGGYGGSGDWGYENLQNLTADRAAAQTAANNLPGHYGADGPESDIVGLYAVASGDYTRTMPAIPAPSCAAGTWGYPCFRDGAVPIVIVITDWPMHNGPSGNNYGSDAAFAPSYVETIAALNARSVRVIGVSSDDYGVGARADLEAVAVATGAVDLGGTPLVYDIPSDGSGLGSQVVTAVQTLATSVPLRIDAVPVDGIDEPAGPTPVNAPAEFIDYIEANASGESITDPVSGEVRICTVTDPLPIDETGDTHPDYFPRVLPGTSVCFDIHAKQNWTVPATREPQMFRATIQVMGDGITILDEREVFFLVPPEISEIIG
ncbi:MAG: VWA domain-containing protein [Deltaproteobacteria bacterium]|nr:VWA domain-containing protein [Deltaproteobacteria bacterium]